MNTANLHAYLIGTLSVHAWDHGVTHAEIESLRAMLERAGTGNQDGDRGEITDNAARRRLVEQIGAEISESAATSLVRMTETPIVSAVTRETAVSLPPGMEPLYAELVELVTRQLAALPDKPEETPANTLRALWLLAAGTPMSAEQAAAAPLPRLDSDQVARLRGFLEQRRQGIPLAHLTGRQEFIGIELHVGKAALVPRKETEILASCALGVLQHVAQERPQPLVIDVCTGVGNVAMALAHYAPTARVHASDLSEEAVALARENSERLALNGRLEFRHGDFLAPFDTEQFLCKVDVLTCNPPYISSGKLASMPDEIVGHEPRLAFDGGPFGVKILQRLISEAPRYVRAGGWVVFEVGNGQGPAILDRLQRNPAYRNSRGVPDAAGAIRSILAQLHGATIP